MSGYQGRRRRDAIDDYEPKDRRKRERKGKTRRPRRSEFISPPFDDDELEAFLLEDELLSFEQEGDGSVDPDGLADGDQDDEKH